jgi:hypothetical protein
VCPFYLNVLSGASAASKRSSQQAAQPLAASTDLRLSSSGWLEATDCKACNWTLHGYHKFGLVTVKSGCTVTNRPTCPVYNYGVALHMPAVLQLALYETLGCKE